MKSNNTKTNAVVATAIFFMPLIAVGMDKEKASPKVRLVVSSRHTSPVGSPKSKPPTIMQAYEQASLIAFMAELQQRQDQLEVNALRLSRELVDVRREVALAKQERATLEVGVGTNNTKSEETQLLQESQREAMARSHDTLSGRCDKIEQQLKTISAQIVRSAHDQTQALRERLELEHRVASLEQLLANVKGSPAPVLLPTPGPSPK